MKTISIFYRVYQLKNKTWAKTVWGVEGVRDGESRSLISQLTLRQAQKGLRDARKNYPDVKYRICKITEGMEVIKS